MVSASMQSITNASSSGSSVTTPLVAAGPMVDFVCVRPRMTVGIPSGPRTQEWGRVSELTRACASLPVDS